ncbi:hypothetical protein J2P12_01570 [Candidatus Bathyarchaeota archaeon]|nr:hypothetical protein [Candidatus Bathyarchaeota archaeon]
MSYQTDSSEKTQFEDLQEMSSASGSVVKALQMHIPETVLEHDAEKKRVKKGILSDSEERKIFQKTLYLPYLDFTYRFPAPKGFLSKQTIVGQGRSVVLALREADFGFYPDLVELAPQLVEIEPEPDSIVQGVDSTVLVSERLEELKRMLFDYDNQLQELSKQYGSLLKTEQAKREVKDNIDHLKKARDTRWKMFADGLKLPSRIDLDTLELLEGSLFYMPFFIVKLTRSRESRFLVWDRLGKEHESMAEELMKNRQFRDLVQSHVKDQMPPEEYEADADEPADESLVDDKTVDY